MSTIVIIDHGVVGPIALAARQPVVLLSGSFQQVWNGIKDLISGLSAADQALVLGGAAERIYNLARTR